MFVMIYILLFLIIIIGGFFFFYYHCINLSDKTARTCEIIGYAALIAFIIWQMLIKNILLEEFYNDDWYFLNQKLHYIFKAITTIIDESSFDTSAAWSSFYDMESADYTNLQLKTTDWIEFILQFISTIGIAIGRFQELKNQKEK